MFDVNQVNIEIENRFPAVGAEIIPISYGPNRSRLIIKTPDILLIFGPEKLIVSGNYELTAFVSLNCGESEVKLIEFFQKLDQKLFQIMRDKWKNHELFNDTSLETKFTLTDQTLNSYLRKKQQTITKSVSKSAFIFDIICIVFEFFME